MLLRRNDFELDATNERKTDFKLSKKTFLLPRVGTESGRFLQTWIRSRLLLLQRNLRVVAISRNLVSLFQIHLIFDFKKSVVSTIHAMIAKSLFMSLPLGDLKRYSANYSATFHGRRNMLRTVTILQHFDSSTSQKVGFATFFAPRRSCYCRGSTTAWQLCECTETKQF